MNKAWFQNHANKFKEFDNKLWVDHNGYKVDENQ